MIRLSIIIFVGIAALAGCTSPEPRETPGDRALRDPMNYTIDNDRRDISGGGLLDYDKKAMGKDMNDVLNP